MQKGAKWGVHGLRPNTWQRTGVGRPGVTGRPEAREGPDVRCLLDVLRFSSGGLRSVVRSGSDVWASVVCGASDVRLFWLGCGSVGRK